MKPDWKDAPEWANWLAMDECGEWYWYEHDPVTLARVWGSPDGGKVISAEPDSDCDWRETREKRP